MKKLFNICPYTSYRNEQFMKDCVLIPYTFSKLYDYETTIVTAKREEYTYLDMLPDLHVDIVPTPLEGTSWTDFCTTYISKHYEEIDLLFCFGSYEANQAMVPLYKKLNPNGKVILKLDGNSGWMDRLLVTNNNLYAMYEHCDIITCESKKLKELLSIKWPFQIDYVVNGFLDELCITPPAVYEEKENIILTVGRIGSTQKATNLLLDAFALHKDRYPDWQLRLVGPVEPAFQPYIEEYFLQHPDLRDRVIFTGKIVEKHKLQEEYRKAKVFAMTSLYEGGTPNVFSEAAYHGCYTICSTIDAADEFTNDSRCGSIFPVGDTNALSELLLTVLDPSFESQLCKNHASMREYHRRHFDYKKIVSRLMHLLTLKEELRHDA